MNKILTDKPSSALAPFSLLAAACLTVFLLFVWQGNVGFNLWDEGFLWYGVQRVVKGEVPIRDFMSYDPGRYYWTAAFVSVIGDSGIMQVRAGVAIFQALGLFTALLLIARSTRIEGKSKLLYWAIIVITLAVWMFPRHKLFDISLSIFLIGVLAILIEKPTPRRFFAAGAAIGIVAVFGRNHAVYGVIGSIGVLLWLSINAEAGMNVVRGIMYWAAGVAIGFLPVILLVLLAPGFGIAFWKSIVFLFEQRSTNLPLPLPWPWKVDFVNQPLETAAHELLVGIFFIGVVAFGWIGALWAVRARLRRRAVPPALVASIFLAIPYSHYVLSRADIGHLALSIFPMLIGSFIFLAMLDIKTRWLLSMALCAASLWVMSILHPGWQCMAISQCVDVTISGSKLKVDTATAENVAFLRRVADQYAPNREAFVAAPFWPGAYALLERKSPMWEIYPILPKNERFEREEIERIKAAAPRFILLSNSALDGRDELRFQNTHPLTYRYIVDNFEPVNIPSNSGFQVYKARSANL